MNETTEILIEAREWLSDPKHWMKHDYGILNRTGSSILPNGKRTIYQSNCMFGAVREVAQSHNSTHGMDAVIRLEVVAAEQFPEILKETGTFIGSFNDHSSFTHDDVLTVFDKAILNDD